MKNVIRLLLGSGAIMLSLLSVSAVYAGDYGSGYGGGSHDGYVQKSHESHEADDTTPNHGDDEADGDLRDDEVVTGDVDAEDNGDEEEVVVQKHKSQKEDPTNLRAN